MYLKFYKSLAMLILTCLLIRPVWADTNVVGGVTGNYFGIQLGGSNIHAQDETLPNASGVPTLTKPSRKGYGARVFWGYQFIQYLALEGGYTYYSPAVYNITNGNSTELRIQSLDLEGKGILPLYWGFNIYGKAGAAIVAYHEGGLLAPNPLSSHDGANGQTVRPLFGIGLTYTFTPNWSVDVSVSRITQGGIVPKTDFYSVGLAYHAVDLYCGQFLC